MYRCLYRIFCIVLLGAVPLSAQFTDSFHNTDISSNPEWIYNAADFTVENGRLRSNLLSASAVKFGISGKYNSENSEIWSFDVQMSFNPSSGNYIDLFVAADTLVEYATRGYFIRLGNTKDEISLYKLSAGNAVEIISGTDFLLNTSSSHFVVMLQRSAGNWILSRRQVSEDTFVLEGQCADGSFQGEEYLGMLVVQSGSNARKHYFDNIYSGAIIKDTSGPVLKTAVFVHPDKLLVQFNEPVHNAQVAEFSVNGIGNPAFVLADSFDARMLILEFAMPFQLHKTFVLNNRNTRDVHGNFSNNGNISFSTFFADTPKTGDLIFTEIMAKPEPGLGNFPEAEYLELLNISNKVLSLKSCLVSDGSTEGILPDSILYPGNYMCISKNSWAQLALFGQWAGCEAFPALNNDADELKLFNVKGELITEITYSENWHSDKMKKAGGWSLELIDTGMYCVKAGNWNSAVGQGGSPGKSNTIAGKLKQPPLPRFEKTEVMNAHEIRVFFSGTGFSKSVLDPMNYRILEWNAQPGAVNYSTKENIILLYFDSIFTENRVLHLEITGLQACFGVPITSLNLRTGMPDPWLQPGDLGINELLFDPVGDGADYLEIFNRSERIIDLRHLRMATTDLSGQRDQFIPIADSGYLVFPGDHVAFCTDVQWLAQNYTLNFPENILHVVSTPTWANDKGTVLLLDRQGVMIDSFAYAATFHSSLLADREGVALEKISTTLRQQDGVIWKSATASSGFGTPGYQNSQFLADREESKKIFSTDKKYFRPDGDGFDDLFIIRYKFPAPGFLLTMRIFNESGMYMECPYSNFSVDDEGVLSWDGNAGLERARPGNYVASLEAFDQKGVLYRARFSFSLLGN